MEEIVTKWLPRLEMAEIEFYLEAHGYNDYTRIGFYETFLIQSDKKVLQYDREVRLKIKTTLSDDELLELEQCRQYCVEEIRKLKDKEE